MVVDNRTEQTMSNAPATRRQFDSQDDEIEYFRGKVIHWVTESDWSKAQHFGDRLAELVGEPDPIALVRQVKNRVLEAITAVWHLGHWISVCESRRDFERAAEFQDVSISIRKLYLRGFYTDSDHGDDDFKEDVELLIDGYEIQARRIIIYMDDVERARRAMRNALKVSNAYGVPFDAGQRDLAAELEVDL
jgi:hypothetical protein